MTRKALLVLNGDFPPQEILNNLLAQTNFIAAADGGANHLKALGLQPDLVVGDLDSLEDGLRPAWSANCQFEVHPRDKDLMDFELALQALSARGFQEADILSWKSANFDYSLTNLWIAGRSPLKTRLHSKECEVWILNEAVPELLIERSKTQSPASLFVLRGPATLKTSGLQWELHWQSESPPTASQSNRLKAQSAKFSLTEGAVSLHLPRTSS